MLARQAQAPGSPASTNHHSGANASGARYLADYLATGPGAGLILAAISCGAVFMGANTYIGNGPNFMVKAIAEENGVQMPSFFGYMKWSGSGCCRSSSQRRP